MPVKRSWGFGMYYRILIVTFLVAATPAYAREKPWTEVRSPHFRVLTDGSENNARHVAREFEQMRYVFADRHPDFRLEGGAPLLILAARDEVTAKSLEPLLWKLKGVKPAGVFHHAWDKEYVVLQMDEWERGAHEVVYHEYAHSVLHLNFHWLPLWLDEGMANFYGYSRFQEHKILVGAPPEKRYEMPGGARIPIETLIEVNQGSSYYHDSDKVFQFYAESWALVHFMMFGPGMDHGKRLNQFSALLQQGMEQKKAFLQAFGDFKQMDNSLDTYLRTFAMQTGVLPDPPQIDEKNFRVRTLSAAEAEAELAGFHLFSRDLVGALPLVEKALKDDPQLGLAHEDMGYLDFSEGKDAEALEQFTQAVAMDPNLPLALFSKTMLSPIASSDSPADRAAFKASLTKVLELDPQFAPAYVQLARLAVRQGDLQHAFGLSRKAEQLEPQRAGYHIMSGQILLRMGKGADAAVFAKYVAERWRGADHDEAVELWDKIPADQQPAGDAPTASPFEGMQPLIGRVKSIVCAEKQASQFMVDHDGQTLIFHRKGPVISGFSDTLWYGADHFEFCHHLEGLRAVVHYRPPADATYAGDLGGFEIRDDLPVSEKTVPPPDHP